MNDSSIANIFGGVLLLMLLMAVVVIVWKGSSLKQDLGVLFHRIVIDQKLVWLSILLLALSLVEASYTAVSHAEGIAVRGQLPVAARLGMHAVVNLIAFVIQVSLASIISVAFISVTNFFSELGGYARATKDKKKFAPVLKSMGMVLVQLVLVSMSVFIAFAAPVFNIYVLAANMMEIPQLTLFWSDCWIDMRAVYAATPRTYLTVTYLTPSDVGYLGDNYSPYSDMSTALKVLIVGGALHLMVAIFDGIYVFSTQSKPVSKPDATGNNTNASAGAPISDSKGKPIMDALKAIFKIIYPEGNKVKYEDAAATRYAAIMKKFEKSSSDMAAALGKLSKAKKAMDPSKWETETVETRTKILAELNALFSEVGATISKADLKEAAERFQQ